MNCILIYIIKENIMDNELYNEKVAVVGLGYVGIPLAVAFAEKGEKVIGFDVNKEKIELYKDGIDPTLEVGSKRLKRVNMEMTFSDNPEVLNEAKYIIIAVPTPVTKDNMPDLGPVLSASKLVAENMAKGTIVIYESTVYPGATEESCIPALERYSGLTCGIDFKIGYSPERINPGDTVNTLEKIVKVVSGMDEDSLEEIAELYEIVIDAGVHRASSIMVAEASKVIENTQRDINIAFMNELSNIFSLMGIDTQEVLEAAGTKWNFLKFQPGLVGGHCIGVDPFYLANRAKDLGYDADLIFNARRINDSMGEFVALKTMSLINKKEIKNPNVLVMGFTFKEDCPDLRNTKVIDIVKELESNNCNVTITDPYADPSEAKDHYGVEIVNSDDLGEYDAIVVAVAHNSYRLLDVNYLSRYLKFDRNIIVDVKGIFDRKEAELNFDYYRL